MSDGRRAAEAPGRKGALRGVALERPDRDGSSGCGIPGMVDEKTKKPDSAKYPGAEALSGAASGALRERGGEMTVQGIPREYDQWLGGVEPAWTILEPSMSEDVMREPPFKGGVLGLAVDLTADEFAQSAFVRNALVLLRATAEGDGLELTARRNLTRNTVAAMRAAMEWPGCAFEEKWRAGKLLSEHHVEELRLVRELLELDGLAKRGGGKLRAGAAGRAVLAGRQSRLQANLFRNAFWQVSLNLFGDGECGSWPQQQIGLVLWSLSTTGHRLQETVDLMRLSVLPDEAVVRKPEWVAPTLFVLRVLRPLSWFGLVECREEPVSRYQAVWRKTDLFDRFFGFDADLVRIGGSVH